MAGDKNLSGFGHHALPMAFTGWSMMSAHKAANAAETSVQEFAEQMGMNEQDFLASSTLAQRYLADQSTNTVRAGAKTVAPLMVPGGMITQLAVGMLTDPVVKKVVDAGTSPEEVEESMQALNQINEHWNKTHQVDAMSVGAILTGQMNSTEVHDVKYAQGATQASPLYPDQPERQVIESYDSQLTVSSKAIALANALGVNADEVGMKPTQFITNTLNKFKLPPSILLVDDTNLPFAITKLYEARQAHQAHQQQHSPQHSQANSAAMNAYFGAGAQGGNVSGMPSSASFGGGMMPGVPGLPKGTGQGY